MDLELHCAIMLAFGTGIAVGALALAALSRILRPPR